LSDCATERVDNLTNVPACGGGPCGGAGGSLPWRAPCRSALSRCEPRGSR
jgi:hypothetical protein